MNVRARGYWLGVAALFGLTGVAMAQVRYSAPIITPHPIITPVPTITTTPSLTTPSIAPVITPNLTAPVAPPIAAPAPSSNAPVPVVHAVRFRCEVMPQDQSCREPPEVHDGGGDDSECNCSTDPCYNIMDQTTGLSRRICEKH
jgi:hypothetical protein